MAWPTSNPTGAHCTIQDVNANVRDRAAAPLSAAKVALHKPADAVYACWDMADAKRHKEVASHRDAGVCNGLYKKTPSPRIAAGGLRADDIAKCQRKPVNAAEYAPAVFTAIELARLVAAFAQGVCDDGKPDVEQVPLKDTWLRC